MSNFTFSKTTIDDVFIVDTKSFGDDRGFFMETYNEQAFEEVDLYYRFVQDNYSVSKKGVLRGLHYQNKHPQAKLVRVIWGEVFDVAVDLRAGSKTYGQWIGVVLSGDNKRQLLIPRGFAHGFLVLSDRAEFAYKCDDFYHPEDEGGIIYNDVEIDIKWPDVGCLSLSDKDLKNKPLSELSVKFDI